MIDGFLFDLGNVLVHFSHDRMCRQIGELIGMPGATVANILMTSDLPNDFDRGKLSEAEFHSRFESLMGKRVVRERLFEAASDIFTVNEPMVDIVRQLRDQGKRLVLLSNTCTSHIKWIARNYKVLELFDELVLSFEARAAKPDATIFELAIQKLALPAQRCLYTDDIAEYVAAGRQFGLHGRVYRETAEWVDSVRDLGVDAAFPSRRH